jgi:hypothetical protein
LALLADEESDRDAKPGGSDNKRDGRSRRGRVVDFPGRTAAGSGNTPGLEGAASARPVENPGLLRYPRIASLTH